MCIVYGRSTREITQYSRPKECDVVGCARLILHIREGFVELGIFDRLGMLPHILAQYDNSGNLVPESLTDRSLLIIQRGSILSSHLTIK